MRRQSRSSSGDPQRSWVCVPAARPEASPASSSDEVPALKELPSMEETHIHARKTDHTLKNGLFQGRRSSLGSRLWVAKHSYNRHGGSFTRRLTQGAPIYGPFTNHGSCHPDSSWEALGSHLPQPTSTFRWEPPTSAIKQGTRKAGPCYPTVAISEIMTRPQAHSPKADL